jgi:hypothetical protein
MEAALTLRPAGYLDPVLTGLYKPRRPQETPLYRLVQENLETFLARSREACIDDDPIPAHVERTFRKYLECGIPAFGFARAYCPSCGYDFLVPFSCKTRGLCPSCNTRRMVETAAHLVDHVIPRVPVRQWVLTVPKRVRYFLQRTPKMFSGVLRVFMRAVETTLRRHSPGAPKNSRFGSVAFLHRSGSSLNEHPHLHSTATDGVFAPDEDGQARFFPATDMTPDTIRSLQEKLRIRILRYIERHGCLDPVAVDDMLSWDHEGGFSLDASIRITDWDRNALERLTRYCTRPPFSSSRLGRLDDQTVVYNLKRPAQDGRTCLLMDPMELLKRLAALIPPPRTHLVRYFGVLAPNAALREQVVQSAGPSPALLDRLERAAACMGILAEGEDKDTVEVSAGVRIDRQAQSADAEPRKRNEKPKQASYLWAMLIARMYEALPLLCPRCGNSMKIIAFITDPQSVRRILRHLGEPTEPPPLQPARAPPQQDFEFIDTEPTWV